MNKESVYLTLRINFTGFHTVKLNDKIGLKSGDDFYIYLNLSKGGHAYDRTSEVPVLLGSTESIVIVESSSNKGESYYLVDGEWVDLFHYKFDDLREYLNSKKCNGEYCVVYNFDEKADEGFIHVRRLE